MLFISSAVTMTVPFGLGKVIDVIYATDTEKMKKNLKNLCVILTGIFIIGGLCNFGRVYLMSISGNLTISKLKFSPILIIDYFQVRELLGTFGKKCSILY